MGKTASLKHNPLSNIRSRASRRQTSPGINADKSLKELSPPAREESKHNNINILAPRPNAGVSKSGKAKGKSQQRKSSKQKQRDAKRQDRAEKVMEKMEVKVGLKVRKSKVIHERKGEWGVVNGEARRRRDVVGGLSDGGEREDGEKEWQDVDGEEEGEEGEKMEEVVHDDGVVGIAAPVVEAVQPAAGSEVLGTTKVTGIEDETLAVDEGDKIT